MGKRRSSAGERDGSGAKHRQAFAEHNLDGSVCNYLSPYAIYGRKEHSTQRLAFAKLAGLLSKSLLHTSTSCRYELTADKTHSYEMGRTGTEDTTVSSSIALEIDLSVHYLQHGQVSLYRKNRER